MTSGPRLLPTAPNAFEPAAQGVQNNLHMSGSSGGQNSLTGDACTAAGVTIALWDRAVCYVNANKKLYCAGRIGSRVFSNGFTDAQVPGSEMPVQLLGSATWNHSEGNALCARMDSGKAWCLGYGGRDINLSSGVYWGQFFTADALEPGPIWKQWGSRSDLEQLATTGLFAVCSRYTDGTSECLGSTCDFSSNPQSCIPTPALGVTYSTQGATPHLASSGTNSLWLDGFGQVHRNDSTTFRAGNGADCIVVAEGAACASSFQGLPQITRGYATYNIVSPPEDAGNVVDAVLTQGVGGENCWLTDAGNVFCRDTQGIHQRFAGGTVLAIAGNFHGRGDLCAVYSDGSIWCKGENAFGQLGTGNTLPIQETQVQPLGSARINCES